MNHELPDVQPGFRKIQKAREFQENIYFHFIDYTKAFDCESQQTVENS